MSAADDLRHAALEESGFIDRLRELCGEDEQAFLDMIEGETEITEAARRALRWANEQEAQAEAMKGLADTYRARAGVLIGRRDGARNALLHLLDFLGVKSIQLPEGTISARAGVVSLLGECDPYLLSDDLVRSKREPDKAAIKKAIEAGRHVPGYSLSNGAPSLSVRVR